MSLDKDIFAEQPFGKAALKKMGTVPENFRLFYAGWMGDNPPKYEVMKVQGALFRAPSRGPNKGKLTIPLKGSTRTAYVTREEILQESDKPV